MTNSILNNSYPIGKYNASNFIGVRLESCITQLYLVGTLSLHTCIIILFSIHTLKEENVGDEKCWRRMFTMESVGGWGDCLRTRRMLEDEENVQRRECWRRRMFNEENVWGRECRQKHWENIGWGECSNFPPNDQSRIPKDPASASRQTLPITGVSFSMW